MSNYYSFDPLVANGITPAPVNSMVFGDMPISAGYSGNPYYGWMKDTFSNSRQKDKDIWKSYLFLALATVLGIIGIRKLKKLPESVSNGWKSIKKGTSEIWHSFTGWVKGLFKKS